LHGPIQNGALKIWNDSSGDSFMNDVIQRFLPMLLLIGISNSLIAGELDEISNYREYSATFASSGQPTKKQLGILKNNGFERIVYIAFTNSGNAYTDEDQLVRKLGMDYVQIPVDWETPTTNDFYAFAGTMETGPARKTLLHCQVNYRASAFSFLYRVIYQGVSVADAKRDLNDVWQPNETWKEYIFKVLDENNIAAECDGCDWSSAKAD
jgi:protein tyrosine phosphatase (PTP) superfamily phosphohydrolase (DUF442 family)